MTEPSIYTALSAVMADVTAIAKGDSSGQGYTFRGIDKVLTAVAPALRRHGVIVVPVVEGCEHTLVEVGQRRTQMTSCRITVTYRWFGPGGDSVDARVVAEAADSSDKATTKAMSIAFRTCLLQVLALPVQDAVAITPAQLRHMMALFKQADLTDRADRLAFAAAVVGRDVETSNELTVTEAGEVIDALQLALAEKAPVDGGPTA